MSSQGAKLLTLILAGACGVLLLLALGLQLGLGRGYSWLALDSGGAAVVGAAAIDRTPFKLPVETQFAATQERPLFNEDRKPTPDEPGDDSNATPEPPSAPLNIALTGIVLTPELRLAMVQDKTKNNAVALKEGMPMPGDQGGWTLTRINPRSAIFRETSGDEIEVELTTAVASPKPGTPARPGAPVTPGTPAQRAAPPQAAAAPGAANPQSEALQRRIEERRKQMRDEAERMKQQRQPPPTQPEL